MEKKRFQSVKLYFNAKEVGENDCIVYIKVQGSYKLYIYYNNQDLINLNDFMQLSKKKESFKKNKSHIRK